MQVPRSSTTTANLLIAVAVVVILAILYAMTRPVIIGEYEPTRSQRCKSNLKQIGLALHNYAEEHGSLPPAFTVDADGKRLHSWRTLILPYVDERPRYERLDLSKPWDDPVNVKESHSTPESYRCPSLELGTNLTTYVVIAAPTGAFHESTPRKLSDITDKPEQTLLVIEVPQAQAKPWMAPDDMNESLFLSFGAETRPPHGLYAVYADGHVEVLPKDMPKAERRARITIAGKD